MNMDLKLNVKECRKALAFLNEYVLDDYTVNDWFEYQDKKAIRLFDFDESGAGHSKYLSDVKKCQLNKLMLCTGFNSEGRGEVFFLDSGKQLAKEPETVRTLLDKTEDDEKVEKDLDKCLDGLKDKIKWLSMLHEFGNLLKEQKETPKEDEKKQ
jgi:hypothetical protein